MMVQQTPSTADKPESTNIETVNSRSQGDVTPAGSQEKVARTMPLFSAFIAISAAICNFGQNYGGTVLLMEPFKIAFGHCEEVPGPSDSAIQMCRISGSGSP